MTARLVALAATVAVVLVAVTALATLAVTRPTEPADDPCRAAAEAGLELNDAWDAWGRTTANAVGVPTVPTDVGEDMRAAGYRIWDAQGRFYELHEACVGPTVDGAERIRRHEEMVARVKGGEG